MNELALSILKRIREIKPEVILFMNSHHHSKIRKLKDGMGEYYYKLDSKYKPTFLGYRVECDEECLKPYLRYRFVEAEDAIVKIEIDIEECTDEN